MTIIEVRGRGGQLIERFRTRRPTVTIGRAFDNDLILEDEYVSARHLRLVRVAGEWQFEDLASENGVRYRGHLARSGTLASGEEIGVGHTSLLVFDSDHPVAPALRMSGVEGRLLRLSSHFVWPVAVTAALGLDLLEAYWGSYGEFEVGSELQSALSRGVSIALVAGIFALLGRIAKHRASFLTQLSIWALASVLVSLQTALSSVISFNFPGGLAEASGLVGGPVVYVLTIQASLVVASSLRGARRLAASVGAVAAIAVVSSLSDFEWGSDFSSTPEYDATILSPRLRLVEPVPERALVEGLPALFERADAAGAEQD